MLSFLKAQSTMSLNTRKTTQEVLGLSKVYLAPTLINNSKTKDTRNLLGILSKTFLFWAILRALAKENQTKSVSRDMEEHNYPLISK